MAPKFALFTKRTKLPLNKGFKNMFELLQSCAQPQNALQCNSSTADRSNGGISVAPSLCSLRFIYVGTKPAFYLN